MIQATKIEAADNADSGAGNTASTLRNLTSRPPARLGNLILIVVLTIDETGCPYRASYGAQDVCDRTQTAGRRKAAISMYRLRSVAGIRWCALKASRLSKRRVIYFC